MPPERSNTALSSVNQSIGEIVMFQKDLLTRVIEVKGAWKKLRRNKSFFGLTFEEFELKAKPYLDAIDEIADLDEQKAHAASKRDQAAPDLALVVQGVVAAVCGDPEETQNGELYAAMGYTPKNQRSSGLVRAGTAVKRAEGGES
jgi:hypothetical protein